MSRAIELSDDGIRVRYGGVDAALALRRELHLPYHAVEAAEVGLADAPSTFAWRVGFADPLTGTRRGRFWSGGRRWFLDLRRPERALVLRLKPGYDVDVVAIETDHPESLVDAIRKRVAAR